MHPKEMMLEILVEDWDGKQMAKFLHRFVLFCLMELRVKGNNAWLEWFYYCRCVALIGEVFL